MAIIEVLLCSDFPTQLALGATLAAFGYGPYVADGQLRIAYVVGLSLVDTVALHPDSLLDAFSPHSDQMTVKERIRLTAPGVLEDRITVFDPKALLEPHESVRTFRKASPPNDELREFACAEGLEHAK